MQHRQQSSDDRLSGQSGRVELRAALHTTQIEDRHQSCDHFAATLKRTRTRRQTLNDQQTRRRPIAIQEPEQSRQARTHPDLPRTASAIRPHHDRRGVLQRLIERRQKTLLAIIKDRIERATRNTRPSNHMPNADIRGPPLRDLLHHRVQDPGTLNLSHTTPPTRVTLNGRFASQIPIGPRTKVGARTGVIAIRRNSRRGEASRRAHLISS